MNNSQGALFFDAGINMNQWRNNVNEMRRDILGLNTQTQTQTRQMDNSFKNLSTAVAGYFSVSMLGGFIQQVINVRGEFQKTEIAFGTMLRSQSKAKDLMAQMVDLAATTPFSLQDVSNGAKQLLAFQIPANEVVDVLTRMGNIAAGLGVPLSRINLVYGQVKAKGKLMGDDLRQFTEAGIPMVAELAKKFNTSTAAISKMVSEGKIGFKDVQDVLFSLTNEGGMFFNLMEKQSKSLSGQIANLGDSWDQMLNKIGEGNEGILSDGIAGLNYLVENYEDVIEVVGVMIVTYGVYRAALIATAAWQQLSATATMQQALAQGTLTTAQAYGAAATTILQRAQLRLNAAMIANPIGIIIGLLAGLSYVIYKNVTATEAYADLQEKLAEKTRKHSESLEEQRSKIDSLVKVIKDKNTSDEVAKNALKQINSITGDRIKGLTIEGIRIGQNTAAIGGYLQMLEKEARLKALIDEKLDLEKRNKAIDRDNPNNLTPGERIGNFKGVGDVVRGRTAQERKERAMLEERLAVNRRLRENQAETTKLIQQGVKNTPDPIGAVLNNSTEEVKKKKEAHKRELAEIFSKGSIADLEQRISLWNEALQKASGDTVNELTKNKFGDTVKTGKTFTVDNANDELEALEKAKAKRLIEIQRLSFEEQIAETKRQIEVRDKLLKSGYSKESVDNMFPEVKDKSFLQYLNETSSALEKLEGKESAENLIKLQQFLTEYTGEETFIENVNKQIEELKSKFSGDELLDKMEKFKKANVEGTTGDEKNAKDIAIAKAQEAELERQKQVFQQMLDEQKTYQEKSLELQKEFETIKKSEKYQNATPEEQKRVDKSFTDKQGVLDIDMIQKTAEWQVAFGELEGMTNTSLQLILQRLLDFQAKSKGTLSIQDASELQKAIDNVRNAANNNPFAFLTTSFSDYRNSLKESKTAQEEYNQVLAETPNDAEKVAAAGEKMILADKKHLEAKKKLIAGIQKGQEIFNAVGEGVLELGDAFGGMSDATKDAIGDIMAIGNAALDFATSLASGDIAGMIKAGIQLITSVFKALNGDKKKERQIKRQAAVLKELEMQYNALAFAAERAFGAQKYTGQTELIRSLEQQKIALQQMMTLEGDKKKADQEKIAGYQQQIQSINQSIITLKEGIIKDVLQTDIPDMASKLGDALLDAFSKGESGVDAINRAFDDLVKNMLKNQLNKILEGQMGPVIARMRSAMGFNEDGTGSFNGLTPEEIAEIRAMAQTAAAQGQQFIEAYASIFEGLNSPSEGMKGDIKGITEKTAGALEAQINAIRIYQVEAIAIQRNNQAVFMNSLNNLIAIEFNTRRLHSIDDGIQTLISKSKGLAGLG